MKNKKSLMPGVIMLSLFISGCSTGTSESFAELQKQYDSVCVELESARNEISSLNSDISDYKAQIVEKDEIINSLQSASQSSYTSSNHNENQNGGSGAASNSVNFGGFEISIDASKGFLTSIENTFSDLKGQTVIAIPMTIKNCNNKTDNLNMFYVKTFGSKGTEIDSVYPYFDDGRDIFSELRSGASITGNYYMLYDGDGTYYISFDNFAEEAEIPITVTLS